MTDHTLTMRALLLAALALCAPAGTQAQREFALDFRPFSGSLSLAWQTSPNLYAGLGLGGGIDFSPFHRTLTPDPDDEDFHDLEQFAHAIAFLRLKPTQNWDLDVGARGGFGTVRECFASDCWPGGYVGAYASVFWGSRRWKFGPRIMVARLEDDGNTDTVVHLEILTGRISFNW